MPDLRQTFKYIQRKYGHNILLQRRDLSIEPDGPHQLQTNNGYKAELERFTVRSRYPGRDASLPMSAEEYREGIVTNVDLLFYFQHDANPKEGDRIYVQDDRYAASKKLMHGYEMYVIDYAISHRGLGGRIEYWTAGATRSTPS